MLGFVALATALGLAPVTAADKVLHVRIVQVKASGSRTSDKPADLDKDLEPLRAHLERETRYAKLEFLAKAVQKGPAGTALAFELKGGFKATATATLEGERIQLVLLVTKPATKAGEKGEQAVTEEKVFETTTSLKDTATSVQSIAGGVPGGDLLLAVTASKDPF